MAQDEMIPPDEEAVAIGARFRDDDGRHRHVWNVVGDRVHYFVKAAGSYWTPGHSFGEAPTVSHFRATCAADDTATPAAAARVERGRVAVFDGDF